MLLYIKICYKEDKGIEVGKINMFTVGVVMLSYLAGKAPIYREMFCEFVPFSPPKHDYGCLQSTY